jgi:drug/metabolite transporter (DMT)-like permease
VYGALTCTAYTLLAGAFLLTPWLPGALVSLAGASRGTLPAVPVLRVFPAALGYATWTFALGYFGAARTGNFFYLTPAVATVLSTRLTGERPAIATLRGGLIAIRGW